MSTLPIPRRNAFAGFPAAAILAGLAVPVFAEPAEPDAALLAACADFYAAEREEARVGGLPLRPFGSPEELAIEAQINAIGARLDSALMAASVPAVTQEGMRAKAALIQHMLPEALELFKLRTNDDEVRLVLSLAQDVLRVKDG
jgi:hypothetical protein